MGLKNEEREVIIRIISLMLGLCAGIIAGYELGSLICSRFPAEGGFTKMMAYSVPMLVCAMILVPLLRAAISFIADLFGQRV